MANKKSDGISDMRERTHERVDKIMDKADSVRASGKDAFAGLKDKAVKMKGNVDGYIKKNPEKSVLIAAGVGLAVGAFAAAMVRKRE